MDDRRCDQGRRVYRYHSSDFQARAGAIVLGPYCSLVRYPEPFYKAALTSREAPFVRKARRGGSVLSRLMNRGRLPFPSVRWLRDGKLTLPTSYAPTECGISKMWVRCPLPCASTEWPPRNFSPDSIFVLPSRTLRSY